MSAPFVFHPDLWKLHKGRTRQPADIVWACNNCVMLMNLAQSRLYDGKETNEGVFIEDMAHNLAGARRGMNHWKRHAITGQNAYHRFYLPYKSTTRIVVLSIIKTGQSFLSADDDRHTFVKVDPDLASKLGVRLYATIPQWILEWFIARGATALDLLILLSELNGAGAVDTRQCKAIIDDYVDQAWHASDDGLSPEDFGLPGFGEDEKMAAYCTTAMLGVGKTRHRPTKVRGSNAPSALGENIGAKYGILPDMDMADSFSIVKAIAICSRLAMKEPGDIASINLELQDYDCAICIAKTSKGAALCEKPRQEWCGPRRVGSMRPGIFFTEIRDDGRLFAYPVPRRGPSKTEQFLDSIIAN